MMLVHISFPIWRVDSRIGASPREVPLLSRPTARLEAASPAKLTSCTRNTSAADSGHQREVAAARRQIFLLDWVQPIVETEPRTRIGALAECMAAERAAARPGPDARLFAGIEAPIAWPTSPRGAMAFTAVECSAQRLGRGFAKLEEKGGADDDAEPGPSLCTLTQRADWAEHFQQWLARPLDVRARKSCTAHISQLERRRSVPPRVLEVDASLPIAARALTAHELCLHGGFCDAARRDVAVEARPEGTLALGITGIGSRELEAHWRSRVSDARTQWHVRRGLPDRARPLRRRWMHCSRRASARRRASSSCRQTGAPQRSATTRCSWLCASRCPATSRSASRDATARRSLLATCPVRIRSTCAQVYARWRRRCRPCARHAATCAACSTSPRCTARLTPCCPGR